MNDDRGLLRKRVGMGIAVTGVLLVAGIGVYSAMAVQPSDDAAASSNALVDGPVATVPPTVTPSPAASEVVAERSATAAPDTASEFPGIDFSKTPAGWYDVRTPSASIVIPEYNDFGEKNDGVWEQQQAIAARCMAEQGFWFAWTNDRSLLAMRTDPMIQTDGSEESYLAQWGTNPSDQPYDWRLAGCHGYAVHVAGMDDTH